MCVVIEAFPDSCVLGASSQVEEVQVHCLISHFHLFNTVVDSYCRNVLGHKLVVAEPAMGCVRHRPTSLDQVGRDCTESKIEVMACHKDSQMAHRLIRQDLPTPLSPIESTLSLMLSERFLEAVRRGGSITQCSRDQRLLPCCNMISSCRLQQGTCHVKTAPVCTPSCTGKHAEGRRG